MPVFEQTIKVDFARCRDENINLVEKHNLLVEDANDVRIRLKQAKVSFIPQTSRMPLQHPFVYIIEACSNPVSRCDVN